MPGKGKKAISREALRFPGLPLFRKGGLFKGMPFTSRPFPQGERPWVFKKVISPELVPHEDAVGAPAPAQADQKLNFGKKT